MVQFSELFPDKQIVATLSHKAVPPTKSITGDTLSGRTLKIVFMKMGPNVYRIKSAYPPDEKWVYG